MFTLVVSVILSWSTTSSPSFAASPSSEIEFKNSTISYQAVKSKYKFTFSDKLGARSLTIKDCNKKSVEAFWAQLVKNVKGLQSSTPEKKRLPSSSAWVKYEGVQFRVLDFEPALEFFNAVPNNSHVLFIESKKLCKGE